VERAGEHLTYYTMPLSIMITEKAIITISLRENSVLEEFAQGLIRNVKTEFRTHFMLHVMLRMATKYLQYLKQIDKITHQVEKELRKSMKNKELIQLLEIEKSLVYFSASLKSNSITLEKITKKDYIKMYDEDKGLLDDVLIEVRQAVEMSTIYLNILSGTMDAYASVISNNLNIVMKVLASITLIISVPTVVCGFYGMNTSGLPMQDVWWFPVGLSVFLMIVAIFILKKKYMI
jgi:magnesium transporter